MLSSVGAVESLQGLLIRSPDCRRQAARALSNLALGDPHEGGAALLERGGVGALVALAAETASDIDNARLAVAALANLSRDADLALGLVAEDAIPPLLSLLRQGGAEDVQMQAARTVANLAHVRETHAKLNLHNAVPALISLSRLDNPHIHEVATEALTLLAHDAGGLSRSC